MTTDDERIENAIRAIVLRHLAQATPAQRYVHAARSNHDDNRDALEWLAGNPRLTRCR